jgi:hypothetical protein
MNKYEAESQQIFISSENNSLSSTKDQINAFSFDMNSHPFQQQDDSFLRMTLNQFNMPKNFYNINETNNTFRLGLEGFTSGGLTIDNIDETFSIPAGDYLNKQQLSRAFTKALQTIITAKISSGTPTFEDPIATTLGAETFNEWGYDQTNLNKEPADEAKINTNKFCCRLKITNSNFEWDKLPIIQCLNITPDGTDHQVAGSRSLAKNEYFNDSYILFGGVKVSKFQATPLYTAPQAQSFSVLKIANATNTIEISSWYAMNTALHTTSFIYLRSFQVQNQATNNLDDFQHTRDHSITPSHILAKIERHYYPDGSVYFRLDRDTRYFSNLTRQLLNKLEFTITDHRGRILPHINETQTFIPANYKATTAEYGNSLTVFQNINEKNPTTTNASSINGNLMCDFVLTIERIPRNFAPNILQSSPPMGQHSGISSIIATPKNLCKF